MSNYKLSDIDKAKCFEHLQCGYNPAVSYRTLWHAEPPLTYPQFLAQYGEFIVQVTRPTGDRWAVAPDAAQLANLRRIERCAEIAMQAVEEVLIAEEPEPVEGQRPPDPGGNPGEGGKARPWRPARPGRADQLLRQPEQEGAGGEAGAGRRV